jgi:small GTP-binding protein
MPNNVAHISIEELSKKLNFAQNLISKLGSPFREDTQTISKLIQRLENKEFNLAILGKFKRGKSSLINALIGKEILPTSILPLTSIPTFICYGEEKKIHVSFLDGAARQDDYDENTLANYVTEEKNPSNEQGVSEVKLSYPAKILQKGVVIIDTPGIGSIYVHNTESTMEFLPQCDAALFVLSVDPPLTEAEFNFLKIVKTKVPSLIFILNKMDYLDLKDQKKALEFFEKILRERLNINDLQLFCMSAKQGMQATKENNELLLKTSGLFYLQEYLSDFLVNKKLDALKTAIKHKYEAIVIDVLNRLQLYAKSLKIPLNELQEKISLFDDVMKKSNLFKINFKALLAFDKKSARDNLEDKMRALRQQANKYFKGIIFEHEKEEINKDFDINVFYKKIQNELPKYFLIKSEEQSQDFEGYLKKKLDDYLSQANNILAEVKKSSSEIFDVSYHHIPNEEKIEIPRVTSWKTDLSASSMSPITEDLIDQILPNKLRRKRQLKRLYKKVEDLNVINVENIRWPLIQQLEQIIRAFSADLDENISIAIEGVAKVIEYAKQSHSKSSGNIDKEIMYFEAVAIELEKILKSTS